MASLSPFALTVLGMDNSFSVPRSQQNAAFDDPAAGLHCPQVMENITVAQVRRTSRRATSNYNSFQTVCSPSDDTPPSYALAVKQKPAFRPRHGGHEPLPDYTCTVSAQAKVLVNLESSCPLHRPTESEWREVFVVLRGTMLNIHRVKDDGQGKIIRSYTLQHAEVGLAIDASHTVLTPKTKLAHFIPPPARSNAYRKDPKLFKAEPQFILRLRLEADQILIAHSCEETVHDFIHSISAAIDIAMPIDERSISRQCTVPRRRRRTRIQNANDIQDPALIADQERILREMYPSLAENTEDAQPELARPRTNGSQTAIEAEQNTSSRDEDEIDVSAMREDIAQQATTTSTNSATQRPPILRQATAFSVDSTLTDDMVHATDSVNLTVDGKWQPANNRTPAQMLRYERRCMPVLLADAVRASDVLIYFGHRVKINWRMELLEPWELKPPSYKSHKLEKSVTTSPLERSLSSSSSATATHPLQACDASADDQDAITPVLSTISPLDLTKSPSLPTAEKGDKAPQPSVPVANKKSRRHADNNPLNDVHGVVFCF